MTQRAQRASLARDAVAAGTSGSDGASTDIPSSGRIGLEGVCDRLSDQQDAPTEWANKLGDLLGPLESAPAHFPDTAAVGRWAAPLREGELPWLLVGMLRAEECGDFRMVREKIGRHHDRLDGHPDPVAREAYDGLLARSRIAHAVEDVHGVGCLLDLDHPAVRNMVEAPCGSLLPPEEVEAARRYGKIMATGAGT